MGYWQKLENGNSMGDPGNRDAQKPSKVDPVNGGKNFKKGVLLKGINAHDPTSFPKNGTDKGMFKWMRDSEIAKGSI
jgi:hypothetical protein